MPVEKIRLPNSTTVDIHDARVVSADITYIGDTIGSADYEAPALGSQVEWGTESNYTVPLTVDGVSKTVCLNGYSAGGGGGEANVIESISINGTAQTVTNKDVNLLMDSTPTQNSTNFISSGGVQDAIKDFESFYFVQGSSSAAGSSTSGEYLSTKWEGVVPGITTPTNGLKIAYRIATNPGVSSGGVVLSINGTTGPYYPVVIQKNTMVTTHYPVGATFLAVFNNTQTATAYLTAGTKSTVTGCWQIMEYDSNTNTYQREYVSSGDVEYPITTRYNTTSGDSYYAEYGRYSEGVTLNPSTNTITASKFKVSGGTSAQFLKADGSVDSTSYGTYSKPSGGIPSTDLASGVQTSLGKADTALQSFTETDPVYSASAAAGITSSDITNWNGKTSNTGTITGITMNGSSKGTSGVVNLGTVVTSETDPVFTASAAHGISSTDISNWNAKQKAITVSSSEPTSSQGSNGDIWIVI